MTALEKLEAKYPALFNHECWSDLPEPWYEIAEELCEKVSSQYPRLTCSQIKEKFGKLCFYWSMEDYTSEEYEGIETLIQEANNRIFQEGKGYGYLYGRRQ